MTVYDPERDRSRNAAVTYGSGST